MQDYQQPDADATRYRDEAMQAFLAAARDLAGLGYTVDELTRLVAETVADTARPWTHYPDGPVPF